MGQIDFDWPQEWEDTVGGFMQQRTVQLVSEADGYRVHVDTCRACSRQTRRFVRVVEPLVTYGVCHWCARDRVELDRQQTMGMMQ